MSTIDLSRLSDKQYRFLADGHRHVGYGGARGGGKSWAVRTKAKILAAGYPGVKILIVRRTTTSPPCGRSCTGWRHSTKARKYSLSPTAAASNSGIATATGTWGSTRARSMT